MKTKAVRIHGKMDLRLEEFELPNVQSEEILVKVMTDSVCMSSHKIALQGEKHYRVPDAVAEHPTIIGHEFCGEVAQVGSRWKGQYQVGDKVIYRLYWSISAASAQSAIRSLRLAEIPPTRLCGSISLSTAI